MPKNSIAESPEAVGTHISGYAKGEHGAPNGTQPQSSKDEASKKIANNKISSTKK